MTMTNAELRAQVMELSGGMCEWPGCLEPAVEGAHLHSRGMGGRPSANELLNAFAACWDHARISDGEYGGGGRSQYKTAHAVLGIKISAKELYPNPAVAWARAEKLREHLIKTRGWAA